MNGFSGDERRRTNSDKKDQRQTEQSARNDFQEDCEFSSSFISALLAVVGATRSKWRQTEQKRDEMMADERVMATAHRRVNS